MITTVWQTWISLCQVTVLDQNCDLSIVSIIGSSALKRPETTQWFHFSTTIRDDLKGLSEKFWWGSRGRRRRKGVASVAAWSRTKWRWNSDMTNVLLERFRRAAVPHIHKEHRPSGWNVRRSRLAEAFASATGVWLTQPRLTTGLLFFFFLKMCLMRRLVSHTTLR